MATKKSRKMLLQLDVTHKVYGPGILLEKTITGSNLPALVVRFRDKTRTLLASSQYWLSLPSGLAAIQVTTKPAEADKTDDEPEIEKVEVEEAA